MYYFLLPFISGYGQSNWTGLCYRLEVGLKEQALLHILPCVISGESLHFSEFQSLIAQ